MVNQPMSRILLLGTLFFVVLLGGLATFNAGWLALTLPLAIYLLWGFLSAPENINLSVERTLSAERVAPGQTVVVALRITNHGSAIGQLLLRDPLPDFIKVNDGSSHRLVSLRHGESLAWKYSFTGQRGFHTFKIIEAAASDPLGLLTMRRSLDTSGQIMVLPMAPRVKRVVIRTRVTRIYSGNIPARLDGSGVDFLGLREYQPGDSLRIINWRVSARYPQALFSNEYEQERAADVGIILDARLQVNRLGTNLTLFEHSILAAAALSNAFLASGNRVGLLIYGQYINWTIPAYGKLQRERISQALACAAPGDNQAFTSMYIPSRLFPANSQLVFVSPLQTDDVQPLLRLRARGYALIVICPNAVRFEMDLMSKTNLSQSKQAETMRQAARILAMRRHITLQRLRHAGVQIVDWDVKQPFEKVAESALSRPPTFMRAIGAVGSRQ